MDAEEASANRANDLAKTLAQLGLDSFQLVRRNGGWKISSIVNEVPSEKNPLPDRLKE